MEFSHTRPVLRDFHVHTVFSDGKNTPEEMVLEAIARGMDALGFSDHGYAPPCFEYCIPEERVPAYKEEVLRLKEKYADRIQILLGIETDYMTEETDFSDYDYTIGSVHHILTEKGCFAVDHSPEYFLDMLNNGFDGDIYALCEAYFELVGNVYEKTHCDIIGHFDLVSKFNEISHYFDPMDPRYCAAWKKAADKLLLSGKPFEINTGAISRGYRTTPYPSFEIIDYLKTRGAKFILSSDCHRKENLLFQFEKWENLL